MTIKGSLTSGLTVIHSSTLEEVKGQVSRTRYYIVTLFSQGLYPLYSRVSQNLDEPFISTTEDVQRLVHSLKGGARVLRTGRFRGGQLT